MKLIRVIARRLLLWSNILLSLALLLSFFLTFIDPAAFWPAGFAGLPFIFLWLASLLFIPLWLFYRRKYWLISVPALLLTIPGITASWGFHPAGRSKPARPRSFTVMTFNCSSMGLINYKTDSLKRSRLYEELEKARPDILCLQEFFTNSGTAAPNHLDSLRLKLQYEYYYFSRTHTQWDNWHYGSVIFSRFPVLDTAHISIQGEIPFDHLTAVRLLIHGDTVRLLSTHLASHKLQKQDYAVVMSPNNRARSVIQKMKGSFGLRSLQSQIIRREIAATKEPLIVVGDLNDIPVSYTYRTVRGNLQDAFLAQGAGLGRTFSAISPNLRIDYILPGPHFIVEDFSIHRRKGFEHFPVMARLLVRK